MELKSTLSYNNKLRGYGKGNEYVAKIVGEDPKYKLKREFLKKRFYIITQAKQYGMLINGILKKVEFMNLKKKMLSNAK